jgi:nucleoside-diphosphate-sugar epimerase
MRRERRRAATVCSRPRAADVAILVTGGAGFIGSHLVDRLIAYGETVVVFDNLATGRIANLERARASGRATFVYLDVAASVAELEEHVRAATSAPLTAIYHLASPDGVADDERAWDGLAVNGYATMQLVHLAERCGAAVVFASTSHGEPLRAAVHDVAKRYGETVIATARARRGVRACVARIGESYGPRMPLGGSRLVASLIASAQSGEAPPSGVTWRMTYVSAVVDGLLRAAGSAETVAAIDLAGDRCSFGEIVEIFERVAGVRVTVPEPMGQRSEDRNPGVDFETGLRATFAWLRSTQPQPAPP